MDSNCHSSGLKNPERVFILSGPSGVGKNTVAEQICEKKGISRAVTATTRSPRPDEEDGRDYYFVTSQEFEQWLKEGKLVEYNEYGGNYYGTPVFSVNTATQNNDHVILVIDVNGALKIKRQAPEVHLIFLKPPDLDTLEQRLRGRGDEDEESICYRLRQAETEMQMEEKYDYTVINDDLDMAIDQVEHILQRNT